jgi:hypothetical protein
MSLLQEMETHGLADCEFNRRLWKNDRRIKRLLDIYLPVFNDHQEIERDEYEQTEPLTAEQAQIDGDFIYWCSLWDDRRRELNELLKGLLKCKILN